MFYRRWIISKVKNCNEGSNISWELMTVDPPLSHLGFYLSFFRDRSFVVISLFLLYVKDPNVKITSAPCESLLQILPSVRTPKPHSLKNGS